MYKKYILSPLASLALLVMSNSFMITYVTVRLNFLDVSDQIIGFIHSAFYAGMLIGALKSEGLICRVGHIRSFAAFSSISAISVLALALTDDRLVWVVSRFCAGFSLSALYVIIESWLLTQSTASNKGKVLSVYMLCLYSAQTLSQFFLDVIDLKTTLPFLVAAILSCLSTIPAALTYVKEPNIDIPHKMSIKTYFKASPLGFLGCTIAGLVLSSQYSFLATYAQEHNISVSQLMGVTIFGGFVLQWPIGKISDIFDRAKVIAGISFLVIIPCLFIIMFPSNIYIVLFFSFFVGGLTFTIYPVCIAQVCDHIHNVNIVNVAGVMLFSYGIGAVMGPILASMLIGAFSSGALYFYIIFCTQVLAGLGVYTALKVKPAKSDDQVSFVPVSRTTPIANILDPRG
jgi:MFS family permease